MTKICDMEGVRAYDNEPDVILWRHEETGRLVIRAFNEAGYCYTDVDLWDVISWLRTNSHLVEGLVPSAKRSGLERREISNGT